MSDEPVESPWTTAEFLTEARAWIRRRLAARSYRITGKITQPHVRPWATALRIPTDMGDIWFKATTKALAHESSITRALSSWLPFRTPFVYASDIRRNWLLMADGGVTLRSQLQPGRAEAQLRDLAQLYGRIQRDLTDRVDLMLAIGATDLRSTALVSAYCALLRNTSVLRIGEEDGLTVDEYARLQDLVPRVAEVIAELASFGIPETLQHDDLHSNNVLVLNGKVIVFDWGDSSIAHPFMSLVVLLRSAARDLKVDADDPAIRGIRDAYLDAWDPSLSPADRERASLLADSLGRISRALTYDRLLPGLDEAARTEYAPSVAAWLQEFLQAPAVME